MCVAILAALTTVAFAWGARGHKTIAELAEKRLDKRVLASITALTGANVRLADLATCADAVREFARSKDPDRFPHGCLLSREEIDREFTRTAGWHFVNIPFDASRETRVVRRACQGSGSCVVAQIERFTAELKDRRLPAKRRAIALMFLVHLVADVHQPLHAINRDDSGGNAVHVRLGSNRAKLHGLWDSVLVEGAGLPAGRVDRGRRTPELWAWESHEVARRLAYKGVTDRGTSAEHPVVLPPEYRDAAHAAIRQRMQAAAVRLADLLTTALKD